VAGLVRPFLFLVLLSLVCDFGGCTSVSGVNGKMQHIPTPFGIRPKHCVHRVESGVTLNPVSDGVEVIHANGTVLKLPALPECIEYQKHFDAQMQQRFNAGKSLRVTDTRGEQYVSGWLDNAYWYPPANVGVSFSGNYTVPPNPPAGPAGQLLYYFIGIVNFQSGVTETILQPVLTYYTNGWTIASWNCCPSGQAHESSPLSGFGPGNALYGLIDASAGNSWTVLSSFGNQKTTLTVPTAGRSFDYVDATLETYTVSACTDFPTGPMEFSQMELNLQGGLVTPSWTITGATECSGKLSVVTPFQIYIQHSSNV